MVFDGLDRPVQAVVDTAAQISMLREGLLKRNRGTQELSVNTAAEDTSMKCKLVQDVGFTIAEQRFTHSFACGPISDDCILGLDFLLSCNAVVDLPMSMLILRGIAVHAQVQRNSQGEDFQISRVAVAANTTLPAMARVLVEVEFDNQTNVPFVTNPRTTDEYVLGSFILNGESNGYVEIINDSDGDVSLKRGQHLTNAVELKNILCPSELSESVCSAKPIWQGSSTHPLGPAGSPTAPLSPREAKCLPPDLCFSGCKGKVDMGPDQEGITCVYSGLGSSHQGARGPPSPAYIDPLEDVVSSYKVREVSNVSSEEFHQGDATFPQRTGLVNDVSSGFGNSHQGATGPSLPPPLLTERVLQSDLPDWKTVDEVNNCEPPMCRTFLPPVTLPVGELKEMCQSAQDEVPAHLKTMYVDACDRLSARERIALARLLTVYGDTFSEGKTDLGIFNLLTHRIRTYNEEPIRERLRRTPLKFQKEEETTLNDMLASGVIEPSYSEWASAPVLVRKKDGEVRYTVDFRMLNSKSVKDAYPLPLISECTDTLSGNLWFHTLDLASGYWQIAIHPDDRHKTAFLTKYGLFQHVRMAQGLCNAPATFQRVMHLVLRGLTWNKALVYLDDIIVLGKTFEESLENLELVLQRIRAHNLKLKPKKCQLFRTEVQFLGRTVSRYGVALTNDRIDCVLKWPIPRDSHEVERFLGFINYHRDFLPGLADLLTPLYALTKKGATYHWSRECDEAFAELKTAITSTAVLAYPNDSDPYILDTDASDDSIGGALYQVQQGQERPISFASASLTPAQKKYCTTRKELLAVVVFTRRFRHYLLGRHFVVRTDHGSLTWLCRFKDPCGQLGRWLEELAQFDMKIEHRAGTKHTNADSLSRIPSSEPVCNLYSPNSDLAALPCGGCQYCTKLHHQWSRFESEVDFVVPFLTRALHVETELDPQGCAHTPPSNDAESPPSGCTVRSIGVDHQSNYIQAYSPAELRGMQLGDPELGPVIMWLEADEPSPEELFSHGFTTKHLWRHKEHLVMHNGVLYYQWVGRNSDTLCVVVPLSEREEVVRLSHDTRIGGHWGRDKTASRVSKTCYWPTLRRDVELYVMTCETCSRQKNRKRNRSAMQNYQAGYPGERIHIDFLGPFTTSSNGNRYILSVVDQFTKWIELHALPDQSAELTVKALVDGWIVRFGAPRIIHSDQGRTFDGCLFKGLCDQLEVNKTRTTAYRPSSNGQVERYNQQIGSYIRCFLGDRAESWDQYLGVLGMSLRASVSRATGFTPNMMFLGREVSLPADIMFGSSPGPEQSPPEYVKLLVKRMADTFASARDNLGNLQVRNKQYYDLRAKIKTCKFQAGDLVMLLNSATKVGRSKKLQPIWNGPFVVTDVLSSILYRVSSQRKTTVQHVDRLRLYTDRAVPIWVQKKRSRVAEDQVDSEPHPDEDLGDALQMLFAAPEAPVDQPDRNEGPSTELSDDAPPDPPPGQLPTRLTRAGRQTRLPSHLRDFAINLS